VSATTRSESRHAAGRRRRRRTVCSPPRAAASAADAGASLHRRGAHAQKSSQRHRVAVIATLTNPADPTAVASCPGTAAAPCTVVSRTTAEQVEVGYTTAPFKIKTAGRIVGWQITLSAPTAAQIRYFDAHEGGTSEAAIAVIRQVRGLDYRLQHTAPLINLQPYFGRTATFPLTNSIRVTPGDVVALTVPTWVPALELQAGPRTAWRASRASGHCSDVTDNTTQARIGSIDTYACIYRTALLDFGAIEISTP
jgi:hypothetical protein